MAQVKQYQKFLGKKIKCIYSDLDKPNFARGVLSEETDSHITIDGDYSLQVILKKNIIKLNSVKDGRFQNERTDETK